MSSLSEKQTVIGVYSDSDLSGLEIAVIEFYQVNLEKDFWNFNLHEFIKVQYPDELRNKLFITIKDYAKLNNKITLLEFQQLEQEYIDFILKNVQSLKNKYNECSLLSLSGLLIQLIEQKDKPKRAYQLGTNSQVISNELKIQVATNFCVYDFFLNGNGGPFQIIGDVKLYDQQYSHIDISGNVSFTSFENKEDPQTYCGEYICPAMFIINYITNWKKDVQSGNVNQNLLRELKSENFNTSYQEIFDLLYILDNNQESQENKLATFFQYIVDKIQAKIDTVYSIIDQQYSVFHISGNFCDQLKIEIEQQINKGKIQFVANQDAKNAIIIGYMGLRKLKNQINFYKQVTQAQNDHSSGLIFIPQETAIIVRHEQKEQIDLIEHKECLIKSIDFNETIPIQEEPQKVRNAYFNKHCIKK